MYKNWKLKYIIEWVLALWGFIIILPLLIILVVLQQIFDPGPIFYCSKRLGKSGTIFTLYKFRSMIPGAKEIRSTDNKLITTDDDPRISKYGRFLRFGFDELPQLINILKGDMCLIGPRPDIIEEYFNYNTREKQRLNVLPGITGLTQILNGRSLSNKINYELDVRYVLQSTFLDDVLIFLFTIPYCLFNKQDTIKAIFRKYLYDI